MAGKCHVVLMNLKDYSFQAGLRTEYLAFGYLAAALRARGHTVTWLDENVGPAYDLATCDLHPYLPVDIVGMSPSFATYRRAVRWLAAWKEIAPDAVTVFGGQHVMMAPDEILSECDAVDYVCLGEGEEAICLLADALYRKNVIDDAPGFAFRRSRKIIWGDRPNPSPPMDALPFPARDSLEMWIRQKKNISSRGAKQSRLSIWLCLLPLP